jgi:GMP synthase-like glutamine amidotransferase
MRALIIEHDHSSPPGPVAERLAERGYDITEIVVVPANRYHDPGVEATFPDPREVDLLVVLGATWSVDDHERIGRWVAPELDMLRAAHAEGVPVLGICFGGQALAVALGGAVERSPRPEIGWLSVDTDDSSLIESGPWFQFHYDRWRLPPGAVELARSGVASQAFRMGRTLGLQFHPELTANALEQWYGCGDDAAVRAAGLDPEELLRQTRDEEPRARERTRRLVDAFIDRVAKAELPPAP